MASDDRRRSLIAYLLGAALLVYLATRALGGCGSESAETPAIALDGQRPAAAAEQRPANARIWVHVTGAVRRPGLYRLSSSARAGGAIDAAGGFAPRADLRAINLASTVRDGQQIVVPARGERAGPAASAPPSGSAPVPSAGSAPSGASGPAGPKISLSAATVEQLDALDGIGPTLAQRIIQWRDAHGGFKSVEQLREVEGIGEKRFAALRSAVQP